MSVDIIQNAIPLALCRAAEAAWPAPDWPHWHRYNNSTANKFGSMDRSRIPPACIAALDALALAVLPFIGDSFIDYDLHAAGMHSMLCGGFLARHLDAEVHPIRKWRRTHSIVLSVSEIWRPDYGGELRIEGHAPIAPVMGQAVVFSTPSTWHRVEVVRAAVTRKTLALFAWSADRDCEGTTAAKFMES